MDEKRSVFYARQYHTLMRSILIAIDELDNCHPETAKETLVSAWNNAVEAGSQRLLSETTP